jgi:hypothetical protein
MVGAIVLGIGCAVPYIHYPGDSSQSPSSPSIFSGGYPGAWANAVEPVLVIAIVLTGALLPIASTNRTARALAAGAIGAMGAQTMAMLFGYIVSGYQFMNLQAGAFIGSLGALIIMVGGAMAALSLTTSA